MTSSAVRAKRHPSEDRFSGSRLAAAVFLLALLIRVPLVLSSPPPAQLQTDARSYDSYAKHLIAQGVYVDDDGNKAARMPGYPLFLAALYSIFGESARAVQIAQCLLDAGTCVLLAWLSRGLWGSLAGWAAGLMAASYYDLFSACGLLLSEPLCVFLWTCVLCALYRPKVSPGARAALLGLALGGVFLVRPEALLFVPFAAVLLKFLWPGSRWRHSGLCLIVFGLFAGSWAARNQCALGRPVLTTTLRHAGAYVGLSLPLQAMGRSPGPSEEPTGAERERDEGYARKLNELREQVPLGRQALAYAYNFATLFYPFLPQYDATFVIWIPFWLFGVWRCRQNPRFLPIAGLFVGLAMIYTFFGGPVSRYRQNLVPPLALLAAFGAASLGQAWRLRLLGRVALLWLGVNAAAWQFSPGLRRGALVFKALVWG